VSSLVLKTAKDLCFIRGEGELRHGFLAYACVFRLFADHGSRRRRVLMQSDSDIGAAMSAGPAMAVARTARCVAGRGPVVNPRLTTRRFVRHDDIVATSDPLSPSRIIRSTPSVEWSRQASTWSEDV